MAKTKETQVNKGAQGTTSHVKENTTANNPPPKKSKSYRRNMMMKAKDSNSPYKIRRRLNRQITRMKTLIHKEQLAKTLLKGAKTTSDANGAITDIEDIKSTIRLIESDIAHLHMKALEPELPFYSTPIKNKEPRPLPQLPTIDTDDLNTIEAAFAYREWQHESIPKEDLELLRPYDSQKGNPDAFWMKDNIIMEYLELIQKHTPGADTIFIVDSQIVSRIVSRHPLPKKLYRKDKMLNHRIILFPYHQHYHWTLVTWSQDSKQLTAYDSLGAPTEEDLEPFKLFLNNRLVHEDRPQSTISGLTIVTDTYGASQKQMNGVDCGVYVMMCARSIIQNFPFTFDQSQMNHIRHIILLEFILDHPLTFFPNSN